MKKVLINDSGISIFDAVKAVYPDALKGALSAEVDGKMVGLSEIIKEPCEIKLFDFNDLEGKKTYWHTASHILAQAVKTLYPNAKLAIGPATDNGFYYDFDYDAGFDNDDLTKIEAEMKKIIKKNTRLTSYILNREEALEKVKDEPYKIELINDLPPNSKLSFFEQGEFTDLCAGPHLTFTGAVKAFKLLSVNGAYWRGNEKNKMLRRIYGIAFPTKEELEAYLEALEEAKKRDHNKLGRELEFFTTVDYVGQGLPILMPKGAKVIQLLQRFVEDEEEKRDYMLTKTPLLAKSDLYKVSGHWDHYRDGMFVLGDADKEDVAEVFALRPMTCPFQFQVYLARQRSYRDLPMRFNETATLFRNEASGEMHGLIRVRQFTISEGHIACLPDQLEKEFADCVELAKYMLETIGLADDVSYRFSKWDEDNKEKYIGSQEEWETVQDRMRNILDDLNINYKEASGEAAFYGPKLDIQIKNVHGKEDTLITIQIDFQLAKKFQMEYVDADGTKKFPYVIHRTSLGCYERTLALLIEKYAGALPLWLSPTQVKVLPISDNYLEYANDVYKMLRKANIRVELDTRAEKIGYKIRSAQLEKIPYMLIVGEKEMSDSTVAIRSRKDGDIGSLPLQDFLEKIKLEIETKTN
jgi:threonyl-tRNA synthetase